MSRAYAERRKIGDVQYLGHTLCNVQQKTEKGWREVMVDIDPDAPEAVDKLRFVLLPSPSLASAALIQVNYTRHSCV